MMHEIEGTTLFDGAQAQRGYALNKMCFSFNDAENRAAFLRDEDGYCAKFGLTPEQRAAVAHRNVLELIAAGRQRLLPRQARRHFRPQRAGHRRPADRECRSRPSRRSSWRQGDRPWHGSSAASAPPTFPRSAARSPRACSRIPTGSRSSTASASRTAGWRTEKPDVAVVFYNDHGLNFFLDKMPTFAIGAANEYRNADEGWGIPVLAPVPGRRGAILAHHRAAGGRRVRRDDLPGDAGRPRLHHPAGAAVARRRQSPGAHRSDRRQHRAASPALAGALLQVRPGGRPRHRELRGGPQGARRRHRRPLPPARRQARRLHQQGVRRLVPRQARRRSGGAGAATRPSTSSSRPAPRASSFSTGSPCAAHSPGA